MSAEEKEMLATGNNSISDEDLDSVSGGEEAHGTKRRNIRKKKLAGAAGKFIPVKKAAAVKAAEDEDEDDDDDEDGEPEFEPGPAKLIKIDL